MNIFSRKKKSPPAEEGIPSHPSAEDSRPQAAPAAVAGGGGVSEAPPQAYHPHPVPEQQQHYPPPQAHHHAYPGQDGGVPPRGLLGDHHQQGPASSAMFAGGRLSISRARGRDAPPPEPGPRQPKNSLSLAQSGFHQPLASNQFGGFGGGAPQGGDPLSSSMEKMRLSGVGNSLKPKQQYPPQQKPVSPRREKKSISYAAERVVGNGSFGVVYQATVIETGETVAIKKVLQDRRFKNRESQIMSNLDHPDVVQLRHCFYSKGEKPDEIYLNLVMEYIPETIHRTLRNHTKAKRLIPIPYTKVYMYQIARSLAYIHSLGVCHRDIKPQNLLLDSKTHKVKLCDFGSAKVLVPGEPNVAYICSRYYRAPELVFEATQYTTAIDVWSMGCVLAELLLGTPLFPGESGVDQLIEIIKILGTPSRQEIQAMNPHHSAFNFPQIKPHPWNKVFRHRSSPPEAIDLISKILLYRPDRRLTAFRCLTHPFFDDLRRPGACLPNGRPLPPLMNFTDAEISQAIREGCLTKLCPPHVLRELIAQGRVPESYAPPDESPEVHESHPAVAAAASDGYPSDVGGNYPPAEASSQHYAAASSQQQSVVDGNGYEQAARGNGISAVEAPPPQAAQEPVQE